MTYPHNTAGSFSFQQPPALISEVIEIDEQDELFTMKDANDWLKNASERPVPKMLFGKFWFENELSILFADSNLGKSILAVQIGNNIGIGRAFEPFTVEAAAQPILYFDFELTDKQFENRYSDGYQGHYVFNGNFYRAEMNMDVSMPQSFATDADFLISSLERLIVQSGIKVVIVDNITYLASETEQSKTALNLMKQLKALKTRYSLSMLVLAHTPKRDLTQPITGNDLQGSKMLMNFCDSAFTIGQSSSDKDLRYLKQIKQRNTEQVYGLTNVCLCQVIKPLNFLQFEFVNYGNELDHLRKPGDKLSDTDMETAEQWRQQGLTLRQIAEKMGITFSKVDRLLKAARKKGLSV
jgi:RecA-family ATPase